MTAKLIPIARRCRGTRGMRTQHGAVLEELAFLLPAEAVLGRLYKVSKSDVAASLKQPRTTISGLIAELVGMGLVLCKGQRLGMSTACEVVESDDRSSFVDAAETDRNDGPPSPETTAGRHSNDGRPSRNDDGPSSLNSIEQSARAGASPASSGDGARAPLIGEGKAAKEGKAPSFAKDLSEEERQRIMRRPEAETEQGATLR